MIFDYELLRIIWWGFLGLLLIGFAISGGYDLGVGILLPFVGKNDDERRVIINAIGSTWEGNQVWFVMSGGALFAAWPLAYAVFFSSMYFVLLLALFALFLRPMCFDYRSKLPSLKWRYNWDKAMFIGATIPSLVFGMALGNLLKGLPFYLENDLRIYYFGSFWSLINSFAMLSGLISLTLFVMHGAVYLQLKTVDKIYIRAKKIVLFSALIAMLLFAIAGYWVSFLDGFHITSEVFTDAPSNPLTKSVKRLPGLWFDNYGHFPDLWIIPATAFACGFITILLSTFNKPGIAFIFSSITITTVILTLGCSMFPFIIPSNISLNSSLTVWDSSSSLNTLNLMFWVTIIFLPLIVGYTSWVFRVLRGKITVEHIRKNDHSVY